MRWQRSVFAALLTGMAPVAAIATNGLNLIGFGTESVGMGGADTAVARDTTAINTNPAGLGQLARPAFDGYFNTAFALDLGHADPIGNDRGVDNWYVPVAGFGASYPLAGERLIAGIGFFGQGGSGAVYRHLRSPFGTTDTLEALIGFASVTPAIAWRATESLTLALAVPISAITAKQQVFPGTSVFDPADPSRSFFGVYLNNARGVQVGVKLGAMWKPAPDWTLGATFAPKIAIDAQDGEGAVNLSAIGLGIVKYREARVEGFALPGRVAVGAAWQATPRTLLSLKLEYLDWSNAIRNLTVALTEPVNPAAPPIVAQTARVGWRDQTVVAVGLAQSLTDRLTAYAGFNYARNPAPSETLTPLVVAIGQSHVTCGLAYRIAEGWAVSTALEYQFPSRVSYNNPNFPLGQNAEERSSYIAFDLMISRRW